MAIRRAISFWVMAIALSTCGALEAEVAETPTLASADTPSIACSGALIQGGLILCEGPPGTRFEMADSAVRLSADETGWVNFGLKRNAPAEVAITAFAPEIPQPKIMTLTIAPRNDEESIISGISCDKIDARTEAQKKHAGRSWVKKTDAWKRFNKGQGALNGFQSPAEGRISSPFGFTRSYVTEGCETKKRPHLGYDIAGPTGTPITAPAGGTVILADDDLYYEGGTVFLDHGHGLVSIFLHMSTVDVEHGAVISTGEKIGEIGATGRVTGPHLHWAVKWRNPDSEDRGGDFYIDPALLLDLAPVE